MRPNKRLYYTLLFVTLLLTVVCGIMIPQVHVNSDMTKYLPDSSPMKAGIERIREDFGYTELDAAGVKVMFEDLEPERMQELSGIFEAMPEVDGIAACKTTPDGHYTLFELNVSPSIDQKQLGWKIKNAFKEDIVVETSQDGSTPPLYVLILAFSLVIVILLAMTASWLDPLIILLSVGLAIIINIGTNALLPSVSITTNYIGAILQLVLSMDFSIILINRYRQEKGSSPSVVRAVNAAILRALPSISNSALTTIIGLLMLVFMKLKIGMDMGVVLAKGVLCSLICTFTALPAFIILLNKALDKAAKKVLLIPTDRLAGFCLKHKFLFSVLFVILFATTYYFHEKTTVSFSTKGESVIAEKFPSDNTAILLYNNSDEDKMAELADSILSCEGIKTFISYPTLLGKPYTATGILDVVNNGTNRLSPEMIRFIYYLKYGDGNAVKLSLEELGGFITNTCLNSPLLKGRIDDETKEKINLLNELLRASDEEAEPKTDELSEPAAVAESAADTHTKKTDPETGGKTAVKTFVANTENVEQISIVDFIAKLYAHSPNDVTRSLTLFTDTALMNRNLTVGEMSAVMGSSPAQTSAVYMFYKPKDNKMTPRSYVHFLCDDLFNRRALSSMARNEDKQELRMKRYLMDMALANEKKTPSEIVSILAPYHLDGIDEESVKTIVGIGTVSASDSLIPAISEKEALPADTEATPVAIVADPTPEPTPTPLLFPKDPAPETIPDLTRHYSAAQMADNISTLGESLPPGVMDMVYAYYGSLYCYNASWTMTLKEFTDFLSDNLLKDARFETVLDSSSLNLIAESKRAMDEGIKKMKGDKHSLGIIVMELPDESPETYTAIDRMQTFCDTVLDGPHYLIGESVMFNEMRHSFKKEMKLITWLTVIAILIIIIIGLRSFFPPVVLVMTVMTAVFVDVIFSGIFNGSMLYIAYLITQSMLMGATIDYGILFANYYKEKRKTQGINEAIKEAYKGSLPTVSTSGLIMIVATAIMAIFTDDATISAILGSLSVGAVVTVVLILTVLPCLLAVIDKYSFHEKRRPHRP